MRQPQNAKRGRGRGRRGNGNHNHNHNHVPNRNTSYESNGPDVKLRGNAQQLHEKYMALAHDAASSGERISAEAYSQFADHYFRLNQAAVGVAETKRHQDQAASNLPVAQSSNSEKPDNSSSTDAQVTINGAQEQNSQVSKTSETTSGTKSERDSVHENGEIMGNVDHNNDKSSVNAKGSSSAEVDETIQDKNAAT